jgi:thiamine transport system permease protein
LHSLRRNLWKGAPLLFIGALFYLPILQLIKGGVTGPKTHSPNLVHLTLFTAWQALLSTVITIPLALALANLLYLKQHRLFKIIKAGIYLPFVLPAIVIAIGFGDSSHPLLQIVLANAFINVGFAANILGASLQSAHDERVLAGAIDGASKNQIFWQLLFPAISGQLRTIAAIIFLYCASDFATVMVLGKGEIQTLESQIYREGLLNLNLRLAGQLVLAQLLLSLLAFLYLSRRSWPQRLPEIREIPKLNLRSDKLALVAATPAILLITIPLLQLAVKLTHLPSWAQWRQVSALLPISLNGIIYNSLRNAAIAVVLTLLIAIPIARTESKIFKAPFLIPLGVSGVILGMGYLVTFTNGIFPLRTSWLIVPISTAVIALPLAVFILGNAFSENGSQLQAAAKLDGADAAQSTLFIELPTIAPALKLVIGSILLISLGEFSATSFLAYGDQTTFTLLIFQIFNRPGSSNFYLAMWLSIALALCCSAIFILINTSYLDLARGLASRQDR